MKTGFLRQVRELKIQRKKSRQCFTKMEHLPGSSSSSRGIGFFQTPLKPAEVKIYLVTCTPITLKKSDELFISIINSALTTHTHWKPWEQQKDFKFHKIFPHNFKFPPSHVTQESVLRCVCQLLAGRFLLSYAPKSPLLQACKTSICRLACICRCKHIPPPQ